MSDTDLISRQALKSKLQKHHDFFINAYHGFESLPPDMKAREESANNNDTSMTFGLGYAVGVLTKCPIVIKAEDEE